MEDAMTGQHLVVRPGRHFGWWIEGRSKRLFMLDWWPTKGLALRVARLWARGVKRSGVSDVTIEVRETR
jgi:hypothetical protein